MEINVVTLSSLLDIYGYDFVQKKLLEFKSITTNDVEIFLHKKAIEFEKASISSTHLVFAKKSSTIALVGYFSLANKKLFISQKTYNALSSKNKQKLCKKANRTESGNYYVNSYLIGQLGKNYNLDKSLNVDIKGIDLLNLAYSKLLEAKRIVNARYVWVECDDNEKLISFYQSFGFVLIDGYNSQNNLKVLIMELK